MSEIIPTSGETPNKFLGLWEGPVDHDASSVINAIYEKVNTSATGDDVIIGDALYLVPPPQNELLPRVDWIANASQALLFYGIAVGGDKGGIYPIKGNGFAVAGSGQGKIIPTLLTTKSGDGLRVCTQGRCIARITPRTDINVGDKLTIDPNSSALELATSTDKVVAVALFSASQNLAQNAAFYAPVDIQREGFLP